MAHRQKKDIAEDDATEKMAHHKKKHIAEGGAAAKMAHRQRKNGRQERPIHAGLEMAAFPLLSHCAC